MEEVTILLKDEGVAYCLQVDTATAARMNSDAAFVVQVLKESLANNANAPQPLSPDNTPKCKRVCTISTPETFKTLTSTPKKCSKALSFASVQHEMDNLRIENQQHRAILKVFNVPHPFMERTFSSFVEILRIEHGIAVEMKTSIVRCYDYKREDHSVFVEFISQEIADQVSRMKDVHFFNSTLRFEDAMSLDVSSISSEDDALYGMDTIVNESEEEEQWVPERSQERVIEHSLNPRIVTEVEEDYQPFLGSNWEEPVNTISSPRSSKNQLDVEYHTEKPYGKIQLSSNCQGNIAQDKVAATLHLRRTAFVKIGNLPKKVYLDHLLDFVNSKLQHMLMLSGDEEPALSARHCEDSTVLIEFRTVDEAATACLIQEPYGKQQLSFDHQKETVQDKVAATPDQSLTAFVKIGNLPKKVYLDHLLDFVNSELQHMLTLGGDEEPALSARHCEDSTVLIEFRTVDEAATACLIQEPYGKQQLSFDHQKETVQDKVAATPDQRLTAFVKIGNLPKKVYLDHLLDFVNSEVQHMLTLGGDEEPALSARHCEDSTVLIEFRTVDEAATACLIQEPYGKQQLSFDHQKEIVDSQKCNDVAPLTSLDSIDANNNWDEVQCNLSNIPQFVDKKYLMFTINQMMYDNGHIQPPMDCLSSCSEVNMTSGTAIAQFASTDLATKALCVGKITCLGQDIPLTRIGKSEDSQTDNIELKSDQGDKIFLKTLLRIRNSFTGSRNHVSAHAVLVGELAKANIHSDILTVTRRRKRFLDMYNVKKRNHDETGFWLPLSVIFGGASPEILKNTEYMENDGETIELRRDSSAVAKLAATLTGGAAFTTAAAQYLISVVRANFDIYKSAKNIDLFWNQVSTILEEKDYHYSAGSCARKYKEAERLYRNHVQVLGRTGEAAPQKAPWFWNEDMHFLIGKDVLTQPLVSMACGSSNVTKHRSEPLQQSGEVPIQQSKEVPRIGKGRVPQLKRPIGKKQQQAEAMLLMAQAMIDRNTIIKQKYGLETQNSDEENNHLA